MTLEEEVEINRKTIRTDGYPMSIGELSSLYKDNELKLRPDFQRYFRWSDEQKSKLLESLLLGIPIPSIFVHQRADGVWDVVDGLQRLSAIFETMGILKDEDGEVIPPFTFEATKYLPGLSGKTWGANEADPSGIGGALQRMIKRSKLDVKIVLRESDADTRLELFQRLNTGGSPLSPQELRNCQIIMVNASVLDKIREMATNEDFIEACALSDRNIEEQYDLELVIRFIALRNWDTTASIGDIGPFLDNRILAISADTNFNWENEITTFNDTFKFLANKCGSDAFRRYVEGAQKYSGGFSVSAFEVIALGLGHWASISNIADVDIESKTTDLWTRQQVITSMRGKAASARLRSTLPFGREFMKP
jgi:hypothetical protein